MQTRAKIEEWKDTISMEEEQGWIEAQDRTSKVILKGKRRSSEVRRTTQRRRVNQPKQTPQVPTFEVMQDRRNNKRATRQTRQNNFVNSVRETRQTQKKALPVDPNAEEYDEEFT